MFWNVNHINILILEGKGRFHHIMAFACRIPLWFKNLYKDFTLNYPLVSHLHDRWSTEWVKDTWLSKNKGLFHSVNSTPSKMSLKMTLCPWEFITYESKISWLTHFIKELGKFGCHDTIFKPNVSLELDHGYSSWGISYTTRTKWFQLHYISPKRRGCSVVIFNIYMN